ncbi:MAG: FliI/YscN family ATPase [Candidatus Azotimanducaceae bacterium]|nr:flagellum-specific ATP synthase FliI [Gammaproteobacteria bacterium]
MLETTRTSSGPASQQLERVTNILSEPDVSPFGKVSRIVGMTIEAKGLMASLGTVCIIQSVSGTEVEAQVVGFKESILLLMPFEGTEGLELGARIRVKNRSDQASVGQEALGRVLDARGEPLDGMPPPKCAQSVPLSGTTINPMSRDPVDEILDIGVRAINALLTMGCGQRIGLIAGSGVGKSVLLGMMTRFSSADVIVIGLIGERGREVKEFIEKILGVQGLRRSVVIASPADSSPLLRMRGASLAHCYAEYFRNQGKNVLLLMDSLTRVAHAQREIGLAVGEPPTVKGYPSSVFSLLPKMIERTGRGADGLGSITAIYTVLAEGDDLNDPVVDIARAALDGQIALSRDLADEGHFPAIDLQGSVSRLMQVLQSSEDQTRASTFRRLWASFQQNKDLVQVGAYQGGTNADLDRALRIKDDMLKFLLQDMNEECLLGDSLRDMRALIDGD